MRLGDSYLNYSAIEDGLPIPVSKLPNGYLSQLVPLSGEQALNGIADCVSGFDGHSPRQMFLTSNRPEVEFRRVERRTE